MGADLSTVRKPIAGFATSVVVWAGAVVQSPPAQVTAGEWVTLAGIAVGAFVAWLVPNAKVA